MSSKTYVFEDKLTKYKSVQVVISFSEEPFKCTLSSLPAEIVYLHDTNGDHEKRNLDFGLPENLQFRLMHSGNDVMLDLQENKRLNANAPIYEPATDESGNMIAVTNENIGPNNVSTNLFFFFF